MSQATPPVGLPGTVLPDKMPDSWVEQIKTVVKTEKPKAWALLLSSSVLAALISGSLSYWANSTIEREKINLQVQKEEVEKWTAAHDDLFAALRQLRTKIEGVAQLMNAALRAPPKGRNPFESQIKDVALSLRHLEDVRQDPRLVLSLVAKNLDSYVGGLSTVLDQMSNDWRRNLPTLRSFTPRSMKRSRPW